MRWEKYKAIERVKKKKSLHGQQLGKQIKTTMEYQCSGTSVAKIKKKKNNIK